MTNHRQHTIRTMPVSMRGLVLLTAVPLFACDADADLEDVQDLDADARAEIESDGPALDLQGLQEFDVESEQADAEEPEYDTPPGDEPQPAAIVYQQGWAWVSSTGTVGGSDITTGTISASKLGTGRYLVDITPSPYMNAQVVAYGSSNAICKRVGGAGGTGPQVSCYDPSGNYVDSSFVIVFQSKSGTDFEKAAYVTSPASGAATYSWNSTGAANTVTWNASAEAYDLTFPGRTSTTPGCTSPPMATSAIPATSSTGAPAACA